MSLVGQTVGSYRIDAQLGGGGMGVVYRAHDTKLDRDVALKFLPPELSRDEQANERFVREAKAASALNHQNVCVVHDIRETDDDRLYIVMPLYEGNTLKYRLSEASFTHEQALDIARQMAFGLEAAHRKGIVHRDIKPANVMVTDEARVVILDFGLAKLTGMLDLTKTGSTVGTAYYMSPEQLRGDEVDERTDLWSLGVVLFQLLTGKRPFEGEYEQSVSYAILNRDPIADLDLPDELKQVLGRLLEKDPEDRYQTAAEVAAELAPTTTKAAEASPGEPLRRERKDFILGRRTVYGVAVLLALLGAIALLKPWEWVSESRSQLAGPGERHTIAVLPFSNLRSDPESDYLGYAMADQVIGSLSYVKNLNVRPASSVRQFQDADYTAKQLGEHLGVDYVVAGNYLMQDDRMRLTVELVDVDSDEIIWTEPIEVRSEDVFEMQDIVTSTVLDRLEVSFSQDEEARMRIDVSASPEAYDYYLRAVSHPRTKEGNQIALELLEQSIALDSTFAPAWSQLGFRRHALGMFGLEGSEVSHSAEAAFKKALELNPELVSALVDLSTYYTDAGRTDEAYELAQRVLEVNPNSAMAHFANGYVLRYAGMVDESLRHMMRAWELDSTNTRFRSIGHNFQATGDYNRAIRFFAVDAPSPYYLAHMARQLHRLGKVDRSIPFYRSAITADPDGAESLISIAFLSAIINQYEEGREAARSLQEADPVDGEIHTTIAGAFCMNRSRDECNRALRYSVESGNFNYPRFLVDPFLEPIRGTPEFEETMQLAREKHERFKSKYFSGQ
jgi:serine/threonine protein kinase/Flp pilus assembly protein TadD